MRHKIHRCSITLTWHKAKYVVMSRYSVRDEERDAYSSIPMPTVLLAFCRVVMDVGSSRVVIRRFIREDRAGKR